MKKAFFFLLLLVIISCGKQREIRVGIQPFGDVSQVLIDTIEASIEQVYGFNVSVFSRKQLPNSAFIHVKSPRYRADSILRILKRNKPDTIDYVLGMLAKDISTTKKDRFGKVLKPEKRYIDWGIFGLGYRPGSCCVVSTYRIKSGSKRKNISRLKKICMHEIGHNLGLKHCDYDKKCVMRDAAETIKTVDQVDLMLCKRCKSFVGQ